MIETEKIEDVLLNLVKTNIAGLKTVEPYEAKYDETQVSQLLIIAPFVLLHYGGLDVDENQRLQNNGAGIVRQDFEFTVGTKSLRSTREGQVGAYAILRALGAMFDGQPVAVEGKKISFGLVSERFVSSQSGLLVYSSSYRMFQL